MNDWRLDMVCILRFVLIYIVYKFKVHVQLAHKFLMHVYWRKLTWWYMYSDKHWWVVGDHLNTVSKQHSLQISKASTRCQIEPVFDLWQIMSSMNTWNVFVKLKGKKYFKHGKYIKLQSYLPFKQYIEIVGCTCTCTWKLGKCW